MNADYDKMIGLKIRQLRKSRGWSQEDLVAQLQLHDCDMSRSVLANLESGLRHIYADEIKAFKDVFAIRYDDLFV